MNLLTLLMIAIGFVLYVFAVKWALPKLNAAEYVNLFVGLGVVVLILALCHAFGVFGFLQSVHV